MTIPQDAVEAAVKAWDHHWGDRYGDEALDEMGEEVRVALEAAAPYIAAQALRDAAEELELPGTTATGYYSSNDHAGYTEAEGHAETWLRARADRIGGGE